MKTLMLLTVASVGLSGCEFLGPCDAGNRFGIGIILTDSITGGPVIADDIIAIATSGSYADTVRLSNIGPTPVSLLGLVEDRAGTYSVAVTASEFKTWSRSGVRVPSGRCHVERVSIAVRLQRS